LYFVDETNAVVPFARLGLECPTFIVVAPEVTF
jgi:hypothetical protein